MADFAGGPPDDLSQLNGSTACVLAKLNADDLADDCRGGARQTQWDAPNPARTGMAPLLLEMYS